MKEGMPRVVNKNLRLCSNAMLCFSKVKQYGELKYIILQVKGTCAKVSITM